MYVQIDHQYIIQYKYLATGDIFQPYKNEVLLQNENVYSKGQPDPDNWRSG